MPANTYGRQVVIILTNKSGGSVAAGDVVVIDTTTDDSFTTTTTGRAELSVGIAQETIANNAVGRVLVSGYAALINVPASVTRGHYIETHTVVKQATGNSARRSGSLGQFGKTSATPSGWIWGQTGGGGMTNPMTAVGDMIYGGTAGAPQRVAQTPGFLYVSSGDVYEGGYGNASNGVSITNSLTAGASGNASISLTYSAGNGFYVQIMKNGVQELQDTYPSTGGATRVASVAVVAGDVVYARLNAMGGGGANPSITAGTWSVPGTAPVWLAAIPQADVTGLIAALAAKALATDLTNLRKGGATFIIGDGSGVIATGFKGFVQIPYAGTIVGVKMLADQTGSIIVDLWKDTYANYPPVVGDTITVAKPTISATNKSSDTTLTGWITAVAAGDIIGINVDSVTTLTRVTLVIEITKT